MAASVTYMRYRYACFRAAIYIKVNRRYDPVANKS